MRPNIRKALKELERGAGCCFALSASPYIDLLTFAEYFKPEGEGFGGFWWGIPWTRLYGNTPFAIDQKALAERTFAILFFEQILNDLEQEKK